MDPRVEELIKGFRADCDLRKFRNARLYAQTANRFCRWLSTRETSPEAINKIDLKEYLLYLREERKLKFASLRHEFIVLNSFYSYLEEEEIIRANPIPAFSRRYISAYKVQDAEQRQLISIEEAACLVNSTFETRDRAIILLFLKTGMRRGEMVSLDISDVDMDERSIILKETAKRSNRLLFFDYEAADALTKWLQLRSRMDTQSSALFLSNRGMRLSKNQIQRAVTNHAEVVGLHDPGSDKLADKFGPHCCRHWFTTHLRRAGMPREFIQELRGDVRRDAIDIYDHIDMEELRRSYLAHIPQLGI